MRQPARAAALCAAFTAAALLLTAGTQPAERSARHLRLVKTEPAAGAVVHTAPTAVNLWFSEAPQLRVTTVRLVGGETAVALAKPEADAADGKHISARLTVSLEPGSYRVNWRAMSRDGHVVNGDFSFAYTPRP